MSEEFSPLVLSIFRHWKYAGIYEQARDAVMFDHKNAVARERLATARMDWERSIWEVERQLGLDREAVLRACEAATIEATP